MTRSRVVVLALLLVSLTAAACKAPAPPPASSCVGSPIEATVRLFFDDVGQSEKALQVVWRESHCDPGARNPRSGAAGLFQLLGHDDLILGACPNPWGVVAWDNPACNALAARFLWNTSGWRAWGG